MYTGVRSGSGSESILVVRLGAMGDVIHALPAVASLKHSLPGSQVTWVVEPQWAFLLEGNPFVDRVVRFDRRGAASLVASARQLRASQYDLAVDFQGLIKSALVASVARADRIFGFHYTQVRERAAALFYSDKTFSSSLHVVDKNLDLARAAGASGILKAFPLPQGRPEGQLPGEFVLACPLAGWKSKQWPLEYYRRLAVMVQAELGMPLVLNGPPGAAELLDGMAEAERHFSSVEGLIWATRRARAVVGVDSGPLHIAAALGKPGVAVFGPTDPARNGPYGDSIRVLRSARATTTYQRGAAIDPSMREITPEAVFEALRAQLIGHHSADCVA